METLRYPRSLLRRRQTSLGDKCDPIHSDLEGKIHSDISLSPAKSWLDFICVCYYLCPRSELHEIVNCPFLSATLWDELGPLVLRLPRRSLLHNCYRYYSGIVSATSILLGQYALYLTCFASASKCALRLTNDQTQYTTPGATGHCINVPLFFFANGIWVRFISIKPTTIFLTFFL